jgi:hypothetical protein
MKVVMDGTQILLSLLSVINKSIFQVEGRASTDQMQQA